MDKDFVNYNESSKWERLKYSLKSWRHIGVGKSLLMWFLAISFIPLGAVSLINFLSAYQGLTIVADKSLSSTSQLRIKYINTYFDGAIDLLKTTSGSPSRLSIFENIEKQFQESKEPANEFVKSITWQKETFQLRKEFAALMKEYDYYNFLYIDKLGNVLFSVKSEDVLGENLFKGVLNSTLLSKTVKKSLDENKTLFSDMEFFEPSYGYASGFFVKPATDSSNHITGFLVLQITADGLNSMIQQEAGYGETGQAYIVGSDMLLRSATRFGDDDEILKKKVNNDKIHEWKDYLLHKNDQSYLIEKELEKEKVSTYDTDGNGKYVLGIYKNIDELAPLGVKWALIEEIEHEEAFEYARKLSDYVKISFALTILIVFLISILVTRWFVNPIKQLSSWGKEVAVGKLESKTIKAPHNEVGDMKDTFNKLVQSLTSYANIAHLMAKGDYGDNVEIRSNDDILGISLNKMITSFKSVVEQANSIASGDYSTVVVPRSNNDSLGKSLFKMTEILRLNDKEIKEQDWLKTGLNKLESALKGKENIEDLTSGILSFFCFYLEAPIGLLYVNNKKNLSLGATYAIDDKDKSVKKKIAPGEGIIGQVLRDKKIAVITRSEDSNLPMFDYGAGVAPLDQFVVVPFINSGNVIAIMELGLVSKLNENKTRLLEMASNDIALSIVTLQSHIRVLELLEKTQQQANELEVQQEELRQANEELQEQTKALKSSEETLQAQKEELKVTNEELEERSKALEIQRDAVKSKNREIEDAKLEIEQKAKDLELASKYKSEFLANMSHELRTPLNSIIVLSQLMAENKKDHLDEKEKQFAKTINSSGNDLLSLINDILDLSKVESGKIELIPERLYFDDLVTFVDTSFSHLMKQKGIALTTELADDIPKSIITDIQRVYQIVKNLFSNAIKFTSEGEIKLKVSLPDKETVFTNKNLNPENAVAISVIDSGIGIPEEKKNEIFEAFKQVDGTTSRKYGGTGLGLSISKNFSAILGGEMQLTSEVDKGSDFTVFLPYELIIVEKDEDNNESNIDEVVEEDVSEEKTEIIEAIVTSKNRKNLAARDIQDDIDNIEDDDRSVLIIEDDYNFASVILNLAHEHNFKAIIALDGESGLHLADYHKPTAIILDIGLPGMDGYEVMKRLKVNPATRHIPVHFISAADADNKAYKMGAIGYLTKPVEKDEIDNVFDKIENIISKPIKKLLVVEDEDVMRKSIINLMKGENIEIADVSNGNDAIDLIMKNDYDCMILDLGLEDMTGFELIDKIDKNNRANGLPIVIYTGRELTQDENDKLKKYSQSIILKGARSFERLLAETTLFLHQVESKLPEEQQKMLEKVHGSGDVLNGKTILVVDDDMRNVFAISSLLESNDAKVVVGKNGKDGLEKLASNENIDLVLMDIMMPEMDGYEAMRRIRKEKKWEKLPVIALTAKAMKKDREKCLAAGANEYLSKPVDKDKLLSLLRVWLY